MATSVLNNFVTFVTRSSNSSFRRHRQSQLTDFFESILLFMWQSQLRLELIDSTLCVLDEFGERTRYDRLDTSYCTPLLLKLREVIVGYNGLIESQHPDKKIRGTVGRLEGRQFLKGTENIESPASAQFLVGTVQIVSDPKSTREEPETMTVHHSHCRFLQFSCLLLGFRDQRGRSNIVSKHKSRSYGLGISRNTSLRNLSALAKSSSSAASFVHHRNVGNLASPPSSGHSVHVGQKFLLRGSVMTASSKREVLFEVQVIFQPLRYRLLVVVSRNSTSTFLLSFLERTSLEEDFLP